MIAILALHLVVGIGILLAAQPLRRWAFALAAVPAVVTLAVAARVAPDVFDGEPWTDRVTWVSGLDLVVDLRVDGLGLLMVVLVAGIGLAVTAFSASYFHASADAARTGGLLILFAAAMLGLVSADHVVVLYVFWELTSILSWLLIGQRHTDPEARHAATHALVVTGAGGLSLLGGFVILARAAGSWSLQDILAAPPSGGHLTAGLVLIVFGIFTKSAQYPTHAWLPGAMVAPTPVSAYLHSATMVKAGVYLALRLAPVFGTLAGWRPMLIGIGLITMIAGGLRAIRQEDLKLLLAMGTVSQLGLLMVLSGAGFTKATIAGITLLVAHALFKATLFLVVGIVDHQTGTRDRSRLIETGFGPGWGAVRVSAVVTAASMAGFPPLMGFIAKEAAYAGFLEEGAVGAAVLVGVVLGSVLTVAYSLRFAAVFLASAPAGEAPVGPPPSAVFAAPVVVLMACTVIGGLVPDPFVGSLIDAASTATLGIDTHAHLALWHGINLELALSALTVAAGVGLYVATDAFVRTTARVAPSLTGRDGFDAVIAGVNRLARTTTARIQTGSLSRYVAVILTVVVGGPAVVLLATTSLPAAPDPFDAPAHVVLGAGVIGAAVATALVRRRLAAVVVLGAVGYGMAGLFVVQGAPDLALTQFAVETLTIVAFVLVLRLLPDRFSQAPSRGSVAVRLGLSGGVAAAIFLFALTAAGEEPEAVASAMAIEQAEPGAGGHNVVNVVLVDFRGLDTLGEITVVLVAAVGVTALARIGRRRRSAVPDHTVEEPAR